MGSESSWVGESELIVLSQISRRESRVQRGEDWRPRITSKAVKLQRPGSGYRVQSLPGGHGRVPHTSVISVGLGL